MVDWKSLDEFGLRDGASAASTKLKFGGDRMWKRTFTKSKEHFDEFVRLASEVSRNL
jgi:hypothetical protein